MSFLARHRPGRALLAGALLAGALPALPGCSGPERPRPRLVLVMATCSLGKDFLSPYVPNAYTPSLERLGQEGVVFRRHQTEAGQSGIAYASIFSGDQAAVHGVYNHPRRLSDDLYLIGEGFADNGYETWFWSGHPMASADLNYGQGIPDERVVRLKGNDKWDVLYGGDPRFRELLDGLVADPARHAFVLANFSLTHNPYSKQIDPALVPIFCRRFPEESLGVTPEELRRFLPVYEEHRLELEWDFADTIAELGLSESEVDTLVRVVEVTYKASLVQLDGFVGRMLSSLEERGLLDDTLLVFTADHGETLYRENALYHWTHGLQLAPEVLGVPLIVRWPALEPRSWEPVTRSIDVFPTLAGLCSLRIPRGVRFEGVDLSRALFGEEAPPHLLAFSHTTVVRPDSMDTFADAEPVKRFYPRTDPALMWCSVRDGDMVFKLRNMGEESWAVQAFDLSEDPEERHDLFDPRDPVHREMKARLETYKARLVAGYREDGESPENAMELLRGLGYVR